MEFGLVRGGGARPAAAFYQRPSVAATAPSKAQFGLLFPGQRRGNDSMGPRQVGPELDGRQDLRVLQGDPFGTSEVGRWLETSRAAQRIEMLRRRLEPEIV